jgi:hypothetical protein
MSETGRVVLTTQSGSVDTTKMVPKVKDAGFKEKSGKSFRGTGVL